MAKKFAVLSGKGGTGKTLLSVNLASVAGDCLYVDCDVEEPNGHLFLKPEQVRKETVCVKIPVVEKALCDGCRNCVEFCKFNAIAFMKDKPYVFEEVCHSCGGCVLVCPQKAITEKEKPIGEIRRGNSNRIKSHSGIMNVGEVSGVPIIEKLMVDVRKESGTVIIDCPPGSACIVMESIKDADYCLLVAEPTVFGAHNLKMVYELVRLFNKPHGVILNKCLPGENPAEDFCVKNNVPVLGRIPFDKQLGKLSSDALIAADEDERFKTLFSGLLNKIMEEADGETASDSKR